MPKLSRPFLFFVAVALTLPLAAAEITGIKVVLEGNHRPLGDLIEVRSLLTEKEVDAEVEIRAFKVEGPNLEKITPIKGKRPERQDDKGHYVIRGKTFRPWEPDPVPLVAVSSSLMFPVNFEDLDLPVGDHKIGYQVRILGNGKETDVERTALSLLSVTKEVRTSIKYLHEDPKTKEVSVQEAPLGGHFQQGFHRKRLEGWDDFGLGSVEPFVYREFVPEPLKKSKLELRRYLHPAGPWVPTARPRIWYATNRSVPDEKIFGVHRFTNEIGRLRMNWATLDLPVKNHRMGFLELPSSPEEFVLGKHFRLDDVFSVNDEKLLEHTKSFQAWETDDLLLYVHGFATDFAYGSLRFAQLVHDIRFQGMPIAFLWPSLGKVGIQSYKADEITAEKTVADLADFLVKVHEAYASGERKGKFHVLAHSMGNRILLNAIHHARDRFKTEKVFGNIILAAPDLDVSDFVAVAPTAVKLADRVTHYHCVDDKALMVSRTIHVNKRVGEAPVHMAGIENVDAQNANTSIVGHDYYVSKSPLLYDLDMLINRNTSPDDRPTLRRVEDPRGHQHWVFP